MKNGYVTVKKEKFKTMAWSGGTVKELLIFPEKAEYEKKDFTFVISTATVDVEESNFTILENYNRIILTLDNDLILTHNDIEDISLKKYEPHLFYGGDKTKSQGKVNDYNFISKRETCYGETTCFSMGKGSIIYPKKSSDLCKKILEIIYCSSGCLLFKKEGVSLVINEGELLVIDQRTIGKKYTISNVESKNCDIIISTVKIK